MSDTETQPIPISALQHWLFCPRQCALIHLEQSWAENRYTAEGRVLHERAHGGSPESRRILRISRGMPVVSHRLGLIGQCDVVELHYTSKGLKNQRAPDRIIPVEYKRGRPKAHRSDEVQLCGQALCLEEMFDCPIESGFLFYGKEQRRTPVSIDEKLRRLTLGIISEIGVVFETLATPRAIYSKQKCSRCSLFDICQPRASRYKRGASAWFASRISRA